MSYTATTSRAETFTLTHAKQIAAKVATDLMRFTRFYRNPTVQEINDYETELTALIREGYLERVIYGYVRNGKWVEALMYTALPDGTLMSDDDPGKIRPGQDVPGESFTSHLWRTSKWHNLTTDQQTAFYADLPFRRVPREERQLESGYWSPDLTYSAGGRGISRSKIVR